MKHYKLDQLSKKLDNQMIGPFQIIEQVRHVYQLDLPPIIRIYDMFSPDKLWKAANNPLSGQQQELPEPIKINNDQE